MTTDNDEARASEQEKLFTGNLPVKVGLERIRKRLLDLTRRNKLLNFHNLNRQTKSARLLRVIDTSPVELFQEIYISSKSIDILPIPEAGKDDWIQDERGVLRRPDVKKWAEACGIDTSFELDGTSGSAIRSLQYPDDLENTLRKIDQAYRTSIEETGTNILQLVFGFMEWYESDDSDKPLLSPLMVLPITIKKGSVDQSTGFFNYSIEHSGEDLTENITLRQKLKAEFNLELPPLLDDDTPDSYFKRIDQFAKNRSRWQVKCQVCICLLSFGKLLMYLDLDPARWPQGHGLDMHGTIKALFEGTDREESHSFAAELSIDDNQQALSLPLVYDADSSQHSALIDALDGRNLVIEGPPGTGKSQTITNLIAGKLAEGKTVLFISEKLAALEVVRRNLDRAKLGKFCLELHSHKTQKRKLLDDIKARRESTFTDPSNLDPKIQELEDKRLRLRRYVHAINAVKGNLLGKTVHEILWASERYRAQLGDLAQHLSALNIAGAPTANLVRFSEQSEAVNQFTQHLIEIGDWGPGTPWYGYTPYQLLFGDDAKVASTLEAISIETNSLNTYLLDQENEIGLALPRDEDNAKELLRGVTNIAGLAGSEAFELLPQILERTTREAFYEHKSHVDFLNVALPTLKSHFRSVDDLTDKDIELIAEVSDKARYISQQDVLHPDLVTRGSQALTVATRLKDAMPTYELVGKTLNIAYASFADIEIIRKIIAAVSTAPTELLDLRRTEWFEPSALYVIQEARQKALVLRESRQEMSGVFAFSVLPERRELVQALNIFLEGGGLFRFFKSEWRDASKLYCRVRLGKKARWLDSAKCAEELTALVQYLEASEKFEANAETKRLCGPHFNGVDTEFERLEPVAKWQADVLKALSKFATPDRGFSLRGLLDLSTETLTWLASQADITEKCWPTDFDLQHYLEEVFPVTSRPKGVVPIATTVLDELAEYLKKISSALFKYAETLESLFSRPTSPVEASKASQKFQECRTTLKSISASPMPTFLGKRYDGLNTDFSPIVNVIVWGQNCSEQQGLHGYLEWLLTPEAPTRLNQLRNISKNLDHYWSRLYALIAKLTEFGPFQWQKWSGKPNPTLLEIATRTQHARDNINSLVGWADFSRAIRATHAAGLADISKLALDGLLGPNDLIVAFRFAFYHTIAKEIMKANPELMQFSGLSHTEVRNRFIELDNEIIKLNGERCAFKISKRSFPLGNGRGPVGTWTEDTLLSNELSKQKRHIPIRQLLSRASKTLLAQKPCFMMGPLSVAQYLIPGLHKFDVVVMDEASQLKPEEALGAIARGPQVIVVGDPNQLPPTSFFDSLTQVDGASEEDETPVDEAESILEVCSSIFQPVHRLRWHYRSQHHALIAFSNRHFYKERPLIIFPSPHGAANGLGIRHHFIADGLYEGLRNRVEATKVADSVIEHFRKCPNESLGVVTLNISQRDLIEEEVDKRLKLYPQAQDFLSSWKESGYPFFIKNLENVQGDERDVIYISTTFGTNAAGKFNMQFGPINGQMGWRRLNVLFTRAKRRIELFTSIDPAQIRIDAATPRGVKALKDYLIYARDGLLEAPEITDRGYDSDFEISVSEAIQRNGFEVVPQLGVAGFFIDLAVRNPNRTGEFIAGIECDGATYHSGLSVRDRDRLRQEVLERLGWKGKIYRIWSTDWFKNPRGQIDKLLTFLNSVKGPATAEVVATSPDPTIATWEQAPVPVFDVPPVASDEVTADIGDFVTYCFANDLDNQFSVQIIDGPSNPSEGLLNENTPIARALLGLSIGNEDVVKLPMGTKTIRVLDIQR